MKFGDLKPSDLGPLVKLCGPTPTKFYPCNANNCGVCQAVLRSKNIERYRRLNGPYNIDNIQPNLIFTMWNAETFFPGMQICDEHY